MKKTLAQFKRDITTGTHIEAIKFEERPWSNEARGFVGEFREVPIAEKIAGVRYVSHKDTTGFYMKRPEDKSVKGSFCAWPKAAELEFDGDTFSIVDVERDGTPSMRRTYKIVRYYKS